MTEQAPVSQATREAAAYVHGAMYGTSTPGYDWILAGECDEEPMVQEFARFELAVRKDEREKAAQGVVICNAVLRNTGRADRGTNFGSKEHKEAEANADLIAAAPDLYEALVFAAEVIGNATRTGYYIGDGVMPKLCAALSRARGEHPDSREGRDG